MGAVPRAARRGGTVRLWCRPGVIVEPGEFKVLVAPPDRMVALLGAPEAARFPVRYLHHGASDVLARLRTAAGAVEAITCADLDTAIAAVRLSRDAVLALEWHPALAAGLDPGAGGAHVARLGAALRRRAASSIVVAYAPAMDDMLRQLADGSDQVVWLVPGTTAPRSAVAAEVRAAGQRTLAEAVWDGSS